MDFQTITPDMKGMAESYIKPWRLQCSEYTFTNLFMWGQGGAIKLAEHGGALYFLLDWYPGGVPFMFAPLTKDTGADYASVLEAGAEYMRRHGWPVLYKGISGPIKEVFERCPGWALTEDRDNFDYVYTAAELISLAGKKLHAKRNHINQFNALYGESAEYVRLTPDMADECRGLFARWFSEKDPSDADSKELCAILAVMANMEKLGVVGGGIRIDGVLSAFTLGEAVDEHLAVVHIEKADSEITGLYTVINNSFIKREFSSMTYINREEDMGMEGLRRAKLSYNPAFLLEKFEGRPKA